jgi:hypothetical protein
VEDQKRSVGKAKVCASAGCREAVEFFPIKSQPEHTLLSSGFKSTA